MSHNLFSETGVEAMVKAANRELPRKAERPLWLRMEHNKLQDTEKFARDIERQGIFKIPRCFKVLLALIISWCHVDFYRIENAHIGMFRLKWIEALIEMQVPSVNLIGITF